MNYSTSACGELTNANNEKFVGVKLDQSKASPCMERGLQYE